MLLDAGEACVAAAPGPPAAATAAAAAGAAAAASVALLRAAAASEGLSGRALRKLPLQAHAQSIRSARPVQPAAFCEALLAAVGAERGARDALRGDAPLPTHRPLAAPGGEAAAGGGSLGGVTR